jgi:hypothetical protein
MITPNDSPQSRKPIIEEQTTIATLSKNRDQEVRITTVVIDRKTYIGIAVHVKSDGSFRGGVTLAPSLVEKLLPVLSKLLDELASQSQHMGGGP